jgi:protoporphyrinogen oxidase
MPLTILTELTGKTALIHRAKGLKHTHVQVVGIAPDQPIPDTLRDKTWVYCPEDRCPFYRVTPFSIFSPAHVPDPDRQCSFLCEISYPGHSNGRPRDMTTATLAGLRDSGFIDADPATTHIYNMWAEYGYPIPTLDRDTILNDVQPTLENLRLFSRGRFGGWKYEAANMDHSVMQGVEVVDRLLDGTAEVTLPTPHVVNARKQ